MSSDYKYNPQQEQFIDMLIDKINAGARPVVQINDQIFEDLYLEPGMFARISSIKAESVEDTESSTPPDVCLRIIFDFSEFALTNKMLETADYYNKQTGKYDLTAEQADAVPRNLLETVYHSKNYGKMCFNVENDNTTLYKSFLNSTHGSYVEWLEHLVNESGILEKEETQ